MRGDQLSRQWRILRQIEVSTKGLSVADIAAAAGVPLRTAYRDLEDLQRAGFPLYNEHQSRASVWKMVDTHKAKTPMPFTLTELLSLHLCQDLFTVFKDTVFHESLTDLLAKVRAGLPPAALEYLEKLRATFHMGARPYKDYGRFRHLISQVNQAVLDRRTIEVGYHSLKSAEAVVRRIDPYRIWFFDGTIYLIGRCHLRGEIRTFVLDRIHMLHLTEETFTEPKEFRFEEFIRNGFKVMHDELHTVRVHISSAWSRWVGERIWHESQTIQKRIDGGIEIVFRVAGLEEIKQWVLSLGPEACVLEPVQLRQAVVAALGQTLAQYGDFGGSRPTVPPSLPGAIAVGTSQLMEREQQ